MYNFNFLKIKKDRLTTIKYLFPNKKYLKKCGKKEGDTPLNPLLI
jgi:hypothetical protein